MAREFLSHDTGFLEIQDRTINYVSDAMYAVLALSAHGTPDRATEAQYSHITNECADADYARPALSGKAISLDTTAVKYAMSKMTFTAEGNVTGRYVYICKGTAADPQAADRIIGHIDLTGSADASSINAEFSFTPHSTGLFFLPRTVAAV